MLDRRTFIALSGATLVGTAATGQQPVNIAGFDETQTTTDKAKPWKPFSDRKVRVGLVGFGLCRFSAQFGLQSHPNAEVVAVSDLIPERCDALSKAVHCEKKYPSLEEMLKDDSVEAIYIATDAPSHCRQAISILKAGKHVATAVPAMFGNLDDAMELYETTKNHPELVYTMFETTAFRESCYAMRELYRAGAFGKLVYTEGEYFHYSCASLDSYKGWRVALPPQYYPTHSNGFYICVTGGSFTEVSCMGMPSILDQFKGTNAYNNVFGTETALFRTSEGGMARMSVSWDTPSFGGEMGRCRGQLGSYFDRYEGTPEGREIAQKVNILKPELPPGVPAGGHGGSHGYLGSDFIESILQKRKPLVDIRMALNLSVPGYMAHQSAMKDGELLKIPQFT